MAVPVMHHCLLHFDHALYLCVSKLRLFILRLVFLTGLEVRNEFWMNIRLHGINKYKDEQLDTDDFEAFTCTTA